MTETGSTKELGWRGGVLAGLAYALLSVLAFPPFGMWGLWALALVAPAPLLWAATRAGDRPKRTALFVALGTAPFWAYEHIWIADIAAIGFVPVVLVLCTYVWTLIWSLARVHRRLPRLPFVIAAPVVCGGWEVFRGQVAFDGYPWFLFAHPLIDGPRMAGWSLAGPASTIGAYGVSLLVVGLSAGALAWRAGQKKTGFQALAAVFLCWLALGSEGCSPQLRSVRVAVVQTNVPQSVKGGWSPIDRVRTLDTLIGLSKEAATHEPDLIVWPETMFPGLVLERAWVDEFDEHGIIWYFDGSADEVEAALGALEHIDDLRWERVPMGGGDVVRVEIASFADAVTAAQKDLGVPFIVGATGIDKYKVNADGTSDVEGLHNSAFLVSGGRVHGERYDKLHLTPFGEVMPYISAWPWLESKLLQIGVGASGMSFDLDTGDRATVFTIGDWKMSVVAPICFEATNPHVCRRVVYGAGGRRADLMVQLTNEGWFFGRDAARTQHAQAARWRCIELGVPMVRSANTGFSMAISADGQIIEPVHGSVTNRSSGLLIADVPFGGLGTMYGRLGAGVSWVFLGGALVLLAASFAVGRARTDELTATEARGT